MSRASSGLLLSTTLLLGVAIGLLVDRTPIVLRGQAALGPPTAAPTPAPRVTAPIPRGDDDAITAELARQYLRFEAVDRTFELVARAVSPAVVHIVAKKAGRREGARGAVQYFEETGSGVIIRPGPAPECYVLTNNHVVEGALTTDVGITLHDGRVLRPVQVWTDKKADVAVLRLGRDDLPTARLGDSDSVPIGAWVLALGSPFGLTHSISHGIISARNRHEADLEHDGVENQEFLQTDAAINPGNSGGPLVNLRGEVIGINTAIASNGGGSEGVGFSIPINLAKWSMTQLVTRGKVSRGALGVNLKDLDAAGAQDRGLDRPRGAYVLHVGDDTPAARAGLRVGDVVLRYNGTEVIDINHLINLVSRTPIGQEIELVYWRDRQMRSVRVAVADQDAILAAAARLETTERPRSGAGRRPNRAGPPATSTQSQDADP